MKPAKYFFLALFTLAVLPARSGDIRLGIKPNPASNQVTIAVQGVQGNSGMQPEIYTILGSRIYAPVLRQEGNVFIFNTASVPDGVYLVKYGNDEKAASQKLIILHK